MSDDHESTISAGQLIKLIPAVILIVLLIAFVAANTQKVTVDLLFREQEASLYLVLLATAVVGAVIAALVRWRRS